ncbi:TPA: hypothetical protein K8323_004929 [Escherichia coli]|uniref:relaxosome protein TraM n=1 Tax=Escherichia coli TaxID=562 RepID=UPI000BE53F64|nr:hypothetical protein [Escherichia coli]EFJ3291115.1 hypothetical protein [Escherichia coli]EFN7002064.1 hypothetical protein [Escherichia coli]EFO3763483.1 hypothetical protein [Escherichia coli]EGO4630351.1 hypothetical protein [Escherichia coli]
MPRIQTFVSNQVRKEIENLVTERRQEGATENDATVSSVTSMLIELGLRVYRIQREKKKMDLIRWSTTNSCWIIYQE